MRSQIEMKFAIGYAVENTAFDQDVIAVASGVCGGCYVTQGAGYWMSDGAVKGQMYFTGKLETEHCLHITLTCEVAKADGAYETMRGAIATLATHHNVDTDWVHVQQHEIVGRHFSVKAAQKA